MVEVASRLISSHGRIRLPGVLTSWGTRAASGYYVSSFRVEGAKSAQLVHRLVAAAFVGPPPTASHTVVNHLDRNRGNNHVTNLEYATPCENARHAFENPSRKTNRNALARPVIRQSIDRDILPQRYDSISDAASGTGVRASTISNALKLKSLVSRRYTFQYEDPEGPLPGEVWRHLATW